MKLRIRYLFTLLIVPFLFSCESDDEKGSAILKVRLTDAPADYEAVNIDVIEVKFKTGDNEEDDDSSWQSLENPNPGVYNLLELTNGIDALIGEAEIPAGELKELRLVLGDNNTLVEEGNSIALKTPSAQQSGLKVKVNEVLEEGITYTILLDFDAARSIVKAGNSGNYILKPVMRAKLEALTGAIKGSVSPLDATPAIYAIQGTDTITTTYPDEAGLYMLRALDPGTYTVAMEPIEGYMDKVFEDVTVEAGLVTDLEEATIEVEE